MNSIAPGIVQTRWVEGHQDHIMRLAEGTPLDRIATPEDVAETVCSLISHSHFVKGDLIKVDGGSFI
ncbi:SDR family oxidoreductase [Paenibacillus periandrae]|uniref:SDR family oxidoreductase n=1 Tax=Paenibacillus periandrae TaxID=1761741 RepID=UPI001F095941